MQLTPKQRKHLEALAHDMDAVIRIGKNGVTPELIRSVRDYLEAHELVKIKILDNAQIEKEEAAEQLVAATSCALVRIIGRILIVYRPSEGKKKNRIELPPAKEPQD